MANYGGRYDIVNADRKAKAQQKRAIEEKQRTIAEEIERAETLEEMKTILKKMNLAIWNV